MMFRQCLSSKKMGRWYVLFLVLLGLLKCLNCLFLKLLVSSDTRFGPVMFLPDLKRSFLLYQTCLFALARSWGLDCPER